MQNSRDSSVLRSLAIAFGDGLAFGVGMKITQQAPRNPASPVPALAEPPLLDRLEEIERRVQKVEKLPPAIALGGPGQPFDQKVLEAVVGALDARLAEQTTQTERRLRDLEAKLTIELKTLHQQDHSVSTGLQNRMLELHEQFSGQVGEIRKRSEEALAAYRTELASLHRQFAVETAKAVESGLSAKDAQFQHRVDALHGAVDEHTRTAMARHQILEAGLAAQGAGLASRIEKLRAGVAAESARMVEESLAQHRAAVGQQIGEVRTALHRHSENAAAQSASFGQQFDEVRTALDRHAENAAAQNTSFDQQIGEVRTTLDRHSENAAAQSASFDQQIGEVRTALDRHSENAAAQSASFGQQIGEVRAALDQHSQNAAAQSASLSQQIGEVRAAASVDAARLIEEALARNNAEIAGQLADLHAALDEHARYALAREAETAANWESRLAALHAEFTATATHLVNERVAKAIEEQVLPLRAEMEAKDREFQQLRQKLTDSDRNAANMILAIGQACRDAAERIAPSVAPEAKCETIEMQPPPPEAPMVAAGSDEGLPGFAQSKPPGKLLRIPLVSSMAMAIAAGAFLLHYL